MTVRRTKIKIKLKRSLVKYFVVGGGGRVGWEVISGMDFMVLAGIRPYLLEGTLCLSDEGCIGLAGRRPPYLWMIQAINPNDQYITFLVGISTELRSRSAFL